MRYWKIVEAGDYEIYTKKILKYFIEKADKNFDNYGKTFWNALHKEKMNEFINKLREKK